MTQEKLSMISLALQTILAVASLVVSALAFSISLKTFHQTQKPIIGMHLFERAAYLCLSIQNHGDGEAKEIDLQYTINGKLYMRVLDFLPPNTESSLKLIPKSVWNQLLPSEQCIKFTYAFTDCFGYRKQYNDIEILFS